jgi:hypothetical protein
LIAFLFLCCILAPILYRQYQIILKQREALRFLTDFEINEFRQGNPDLLTGNGKFFDGSTAIDALPYDERYELGLKSLNIGKQDWNNRNVSLWLFTKIPHSYNK